MAEKMKKYLAAILCLAVVLSFTGCGGDDSEIEVDINLSKMSETMSHAKAETIIGAPNDYVGQTIKIKGKYSYSYWEDSGRYYHDIIVEGSATCPKMFELDWETWYGDIPEDGAAIEIIGTLRSYPENGNVYAYIEVKQLELI